MPDRIRLLLVDVGEVHAALVRRAVARRPDVELSSATSMLGGLEAAAVGRADCMLVGASADRVGGFVLVAELRRRERDVPAELPLAFVGFSPGEACKAFDLGAVDYVLNGTAQRLRLCVDRLCRVATDRRTAALAADLRRARDALAMRSALNPDRGLVVRNGRNHALVEVSRIDWISRVVGGVQVVASGRTFFHQGAIAELTELLANEGFVRLHASYLVSQRSIADLKRTDSGRLELVTKDGTSLPVSRARESSVRRLFATLPTSRPSEGRHVEVPSSLM